MDYQERVECTDADIGYHRYCRSYPDGSEWIGPWVQVDQDLPDPHEIVTDGWVYSTCTGCNLEIRLDLTGNGRLWETASMDAVFDGNEHRCRGGSPGDQQPMHLPDFI